MAVGPSVVLVDTFQDEREMYAAYLHASGFRVRTFQDGDAAFADAVKHVPDLIVSRMRTASHAVVGLRLTERLKAHRATSGVPVLILSSMSGDESRQLASAAGADSYQLLPCLPEQLLAEMNRLLDRSRAQAARPVRRRKLKSERPAKDLRRSK